MTDQEINEVERPFTFEERYKLRLLLKATEKITPEEFATMKQVAATKGFVTGLGVIGRVFLWLSSAVGLLSAYKLLFPQKGE